MLLDFCLQSSQAVLGHDKGQTFDTEHFQLRQMKKGCSRLGHSAVKPDCNTLRSQSAQIEICFLVRRYTNE